MPIRPRKSAVAPAAANTVALAAASPITARIRVRHVAPDVPSVLPPPTPRRAHHVVDRTSSNWDENGNYLVGNGRPPREHQWKKGQSGNPRGPKRAEKLDPQAQFEAAVLATFPAKVNGADVSLSLGEFGLNVLKGAAAKGNRQAASYLIDLYLQMVRKTTDIEIGTELHADEQAALDALLDDLGLDAAPVRRKTDRRLDNSEAASRESDG